MENWRNFQKVSESMEKIHALGAEYSDIDDSRLAELVSIARSVAMFEILDGREKEYVDKILAINRKTFGNRMGRPASPPAQGKEEFEVV